MGRPCPNSCRGEGKCDDKTGKCKCNVGVTGADCSERKCPPKCQMPNGKCDKLTAVCLCEKGWEGDDCTTKVQPCSRKCPEKSKCNEKTKRCECRKGWKGRDCDIRQCPDDCSGHGACNEKTGLCKCFSGWGAYNCGARPYQQAWGYSGEGGLLGPEEWSTVTSRFASCANGKYQSPIRLPWDAEDGAMDAFYHNITFADDVIKGFLIVDNGRHYTAEMPQNHKMTMSVGEHKYLLRNITLHTPSEHRIGERLFDMEMQLNYEDDFMNMASVAILFQAVDE